jgi:hypothetical protein
MAEKKSRQDINLMVAPKGEHFGRHVSIVVKDRDKTIETLSSLLGLGPWTTFNATFLKDIPHGPDHASLIIGNPHHEKSAFVSLEKLGLGKLYLEVIQPVEEGCLPDRIIKTRGEGLYHLSIVVPNWDEVVSKIDKQQCLFKAVVPSGKRTCYYEIQPGGLVLEIAEE